jgi:hypothetical protein
MFNCVNKEYVRKFDIYKSSLAACGKFYYPLDNLKKLLSSGNPFYINPFAKDLLSLSI